MDELFESAENENPDTGWPRSSRAEHAREGLFVSDAELYRRMGVGERTGRAAIFAMERAGHFPAKDPLFGNKRYWPAVRKALDQRFMPTGSGERAAFRPANETGYQRVFIGDGKVKVRARSGRASWIEDAGPSDPPEWRKKRKPTPSTQSALID
jgi:hypothetical protein